MKKSPLVVASLWYVVGSFGWGLAVISLCLLVPCDRHRPIAQPETAYAVSSGPSAGSGNVGKWRLATNTYYFTNTSVGWWPPAEEFLDTNGNKWTIGTNDYRKLPILTLPHGQSLRIGNNWIIAVTPEQWATITNDLHWKRYVNTQMLTLYGDGPNK